MNEITQKNKTKKMAKVNLDALIPRADFVESKTTPGERPAFDQLNLGHLLENSESNFASIYHLIRKPDFQRETNEWDKKRILGIIQAWMNKSFVPSIILWQNAHTGIIYVIDGAHRLSALLSYINDDYGDREISHKFYSFNKIPEAEIELADDTRKYIEKKLGGSFKEIMKSGGTKADKFKNGRFDVQFVPGDAQVAETSFFKINQQGVALNPTEKKLCIGRDLPICLATRIIMKGGGGEQYWKNFTAENQTKASTIATELHSLIFDPPYKLEAKSAVLHQPLGGSITNAMPMIYTLLDILCTQRQIDGRGKKDSHNGALTCEILDLTRKIIWKTLSEQPGSLGLFPSVYFYNSGGKYIQSAFLGMIEYLVQNEKNDSSFLPRFIHVRKRMEDFLLKHKVFITQINRKFGSKQKSHKQMKGFFMNLIELLHIENDDLQIIIKLKEKYNFLNEIETDIEKSKSYRFSKEVKIAGAIEEELAGISKCYWCGGHVHPLSKSHDHEPDVKLGGKSEPKNRKSTHFYCNMSKDKLIEMGIFKREA